MTDRAVFDTSAILPALLQHPLSEQSLKAIESYFPVLIAFSRIEIASALRTLAKAGQIKPKDATRVLAEFIAMNQFLENDAYISTALKLALEFDHGVYDAQFVAAAIDKHLPLVTADRRLTSKFERVLPAGIVLLHV